MLLSIQLDVDNFHGDAINDLDKFKQWITNTFTKWDSSILEHFLYEFPNIFLRFIFIFNFNIKKGEFK